MQNKHKLISKGKKTQKGAALLKSKLKKKASRNNAPSFGTLISYISKGFMEELKNKEKR